MTSVPKRMAGLRIVDAVFERGRARAPWRLAVAASLAVLVHVSALWFAVHEASRPHPVPEPLPEPIVELSAPPPPPPTPPPPQAPPPQARVAPVERVRQSTPPPPAQAGKIVAQEPDPGKPVDLGDQGFVTGDGKTFAGGYTSSRGTSQSPVIQRDVVPAARPRPPAGPPAPDLSRSIGLTDDDWTCPWPHEADDQEIDAQLVVIRVVVRPDGSVESAQAVSDPGAGFGAAAVACAKRTRFLAAHDRDGQPIRATSPPIRVRFTR